MRIILICIFSFRLANREH